jgi:Concanavalin A-like lectin/glucanases superfamily
MSYRLRVLSDNPVGFWELNQVSSLAYNDSTIQYNDSNATYNDPNEQYLKDTSANLNPALQPSGSYISLSDVLPLVSNSSYDGYLNGAKILPTSQVKVFNTTSKYKMFYTGTENLSFGIEFWISFDVNPSVTNNIVQISGTYSGSNTNIGNIYVNNDKIYYTIYDGNGNSYTAFKQVSSWESQNHILATYDKGKIQVLVNAIGGDTVSVPNSFLFKVPGSNSSTITYQIGPSPSTNTFVLNDLVFYDYILSDKLIRSHMVWGTNDSAPQTYVKQTSGYFFDIKETDKMYAFKKDFSNIKTYREGILNNLTVDSNGLTLKMIPNLVETGVSGTLSVSSGALSVTGDKSAKFANFSKYFSLNKVSIMGQINWVPNTNANASVIWSMDGINNGEWIYLAQSSDKKLTLYYYAMGTDYTYSSKIIAQVSTAVTVAGTYNFGVAINAKTITLYMQSAGSVTTQAFPSYTSANTNLYIGNEYSNAPTIANTSTVDNISIIDGYTTPSTYSLYGQADAVTIKFNNSLSVSQTGTWVYTVPSASFSKIVGAKFTWDSGTSDNTTLSTSQNVVVSYSSDSGTTWNKIINGYPFIQFDDSSSVSYPNILFKVTIYSSDSSSQYLPRLDNALIVFYKDLGILSDSGGFLLSPRQGSYIGDTYSIKQNFFNVMARSNNFGIKINSVSGKNSIATITPKSLTSGFKSLEFWFRYDSLSTYAIQPIVDLLGTSGTLYFDLNGACFQVGFDNVYINGISLTGTKTLVQGESYHIVCTYSAGTNSQIYLGGNKTRSYFSLATYGFISLYPNVLSQTDAQNRYLSFISASVSQADYTTTATPAMSLGHITEYAGTSSAYNSGQAILAYPHPNATA